MAGPSDAEKPGEATRTLVVPRRASPRGVARRRASVCAAYCGHEVEHPGTGAQRREEVAARLHRSLSLLTAPKVQPAPPHPAPRHSTPPSLDWSGRPLSSLSGGIGIRGGPTTGINDRTGNRRHGKNESL